MKYREITILPGDISHVKLRYLYPEKRYSLYASMPIRATFKGYKVDLLYPFTGNEPDLISGKWINLKLFLDYTFNGVFYKDKIFDAQDFGNFLNMWTRSKKSIHLDWAGSILHGKWGITHTEKVAKIFRFLGKRYTPHPLTKFPEDLTDKEVIYVMSQLIYDNADIKYTFQNEIRSNLMDYVLQFS